MSKSDEHRSSKYIIRIWSGHTKLGCTAMGSPLPKDLLLRWLWWDHNWSIWPLFVRLDWEWEIGRGWLSRGPTTLWTWSTTFSGWRKSSNWLKQRRGKIEDLRFWATSLLSGGDWTKHWWPEVFWEPISALSPQHRLSGTSWLSPLWPLLPRSHLLYHATRETRERVIVPQKSQLARIASGGTSTQTRSLG